MPLPTTPLYAGLQQALDRISTLRKLRRPSRYQYDGNGDSWHVIDRGSPISNSRHDWLQHATEDDYDNWYNGLNGIEEGLKNKVFESRPGTALPHAFGTQGAQDGKLADLAWDAAFEITNKDSLASLLARTTAQTSVQLTAFHEQTNNDLTKYSTGEYVWPDISQQTFL